MKSGKEERIGMEKSDEQKSIGDPHHMDQLERRASETQKATGSKACHFLTIFPSLRCIDNRAILVLRGSVPLLDFECITCAYERAWGIKVHMEEDCHQHESK